MAKCPRCHTNAYVRDVCIACSYEPPTMLPDEIARTMAEDHRWGKSKEPRPERKSAAFYERQAGGMERRLWGRKA